MIVSREYLKSLKGKKYLDDFSYELFMKYGPPITDEDLTDNNFWIAYFPKGDFTIIVNKENDIVVFTNRGKTNLTTKLVLKVLK